MTSTHRSEQGDGSSKTFAENIQNMATQKPPPPEGKGIVMVVLAVVVVIAALYQFLTGSGAGQVIRENHENEPKPRTAAAGPEASTSAAATPASAPDREPDRQPARRPIEVFDPTERPVEVPVGVPGADLKIPEGIDARTAGALRLSLNALRPGPLTSKLVKEDALRHMGTVIDGAPEASKERARTFLLEQLAPYVRSYAIGGRVLDAALEIAGDDASALKPVVDAALEHALSSDANAAAALVFLSGIPAQARGDANALVAAVVRDEVRPLHVRVLALERLAAWGAVSDALRAWASDEARLEAIRAALR